MSETSAAPGVMPAGESDAAVRLLVGPEGVPIPFRLASGGARVTAFVIDGVLLLLGLIAVISLGELAAGDSFHGVALVLVFVLRNLYFTVFELAWRGQTPGKRALGLQVVDAHGTALEPEAVFVRNVMRELELFGPLSVLALSGSNSMIAVIGSLWTLLLSAMPMFNRDRLRVGDLVAGTLVVRKPDVRLERDLGHTSVKHMPYRFRADMLDRYGVKELQVLEGLLRHGKPDRHTLRRVGKTIRERIEWDGEAPRNERAFLEAFYAAQRESLEQRLLLGQAPADKHVARGD